MPNFSHGAAGIGFVLATASGPLGRPDLLRLAAAAGRRLERLGRRPDGTLAVPHSIPQHPRADPVSYGWCHGAAGTGRLFTLLERLRPGEGWAGCAAAAGRDPGQRPARPAVAGVLGQPGPVLRHRRGRRGGPGPLPGHRRPGLAGLRRCAGRGRAEPGHRGRQRRLLVTYRAPAPPARAGAGRGLDAGRRGHRGLPAPPGSPAPRRPRRPPPPVARSPAAPAPIRSM